MKKEFFDELQIQADNYCSFRLLPCHNITAKKRTSCR